MPPWPSSAVPSHGVVKEKNPEYRPPGGTAEQSTGAGSAILQAAKVQRRDPLAALGELSNRRGGGRAAAAAQPARRSGARRLQLRRGAVIGTIKRAKLDPWTQPLRVPSRRRRIRPHAQAGPAPATGTRRSTTSRRRTSSRWRGSYIMEHTRKEGLGAPVVAVGREHEQGRAGGLHLPAHLLRRHRAGPLRGPARVLAFEDPLATEHVTARRAHLPAGGGFHRAAGRDARPAPSRRNSNSRACCARRNTPRPRASRGCSRTTRTRRWCS